MARLTVKFGVGTGLKRKHPELKDCKVDSLTIARTVATNAAGKLCTSDLSDGRTLAHVYDGKKCLARISYNGKVWEPFIRRGEVLPREMVA